MRYVNSIFITVFSIVVLSFSTAFAQGVAPRGLEREVEKKILKLPRYEVFDHIAFDVQGDTVRLYGKVHHAFNKNDAADSVAKIPGVARVINEIEILPPSGFDDAIRTELYRKISSTGSLSRYLWPVNPSVRLIVDRGHIYLEGFVGSEGDRNAMNVVAHGVSGAFSITNNLKVDVGRAR